MSDEDWQHKFEAKEQELQVSAEEWKEEKEILWGEIEALEGRAAEAERYKQQISELTNKTRLLHAARQEEGRQNEERVTSLQEKADKLEEQMDEEKRLRVQAEQDLDSLTSTRRKLEAQVRRLTEQDSRNQEEIILLKGEAEETQGEKRQLQRDSEHTRRELVDLRQEIARLEAAISRGKPDGDAPQQRRSSQSIPSGDLARLVELLSGAVEETAKADAALSSVEAKLRETDQSMGEAA
eukprot:TRINITY_DN25324_c0_g1_i1.p1 TRINITY_DN25324_c0_g1~~TRINITY_DN25324_c0_g1_i1.p1  ORF type:complete len:239 (+),score=53.76 TRINITY_DN25324_c0_g1_i1:78-794(+)